MQIFENRKRRFYSFMEHYELRSKIQGAKIWSQYHFKFWCKYCKYCFDCFLLAGGDKVGSMADFEIALVW